ncbi:unnamed protein product, partial [Symbiodinium microadriaticum]
MSDLNSPEKPRSEPSLADSQPRSWSDVTLIEDITQESSSRHLSAHCLRECLESSSESVAEQPSPTETDTALVGELHQEAQNVVGLVSRASQENNRKEVSALQPLLQASLIRAFLTQPTADRKEALPLPLAVVVEWEKYICSPHCPQDLRLFLGRALDSLWVLPFLRAVQSAWLATESAMGMSVIPDFILPVLTNLGGLSRPSSTYAQPMAYSQSLAAMRHFLTIPWQDSTKPIPVTPPESRAFTLRSLKVCLLAAGAQVRATEEARQHQGHHKSPSVQLYSRDDTILALDLQGEVSSFGEGVSRFVCSGEADLESAALPQVPEVSQEPQPSHRPEFTTSQIPEDDTEALLVEKFANQEFCKDHGVHEILYQALALKGLESVDDFAYAFPEIRSLEALLSGLSDSDLSDMGSTDQFHGVQAARIRKALRFAHDLCQQPIEPTQQINQPPSLPEAAQELIDDFKTNYPGELLDE